jgi:hypothetical protein
MRLLSRLGTHNLRAAAEKEEAAAIPDTVRVALDRLVRIAQRDTGQSRIVANFLLAGGTPRSAAASIPQTCGAWTRRPLRTW